MRRSRRKFLRLFGFLALLVAVLGGVAAAGWLPPFNHWVERRLLAELRVLGVETDATHLRELSWRRAVGGPVELQLPGLTLRAEEARAELGWEVLARRGSPHVVLRGLVLDAQVTRLMELGGALQPQSGGFPYGQLDLESSRVILRHGERRLELPFSGTIDSRVEEFRAELVVNAPALAGRVSLRGDLAEGAVEFGVHDGRVVPEDWRQLLDGAVPAAVTASHFEPAAEIRISGTATLAERHWRTAKVEAALPAFGWNDGKNTLIAGAGNLLLALQGEGAWRAEWRAAHATWAAGDRSARLDEPVFVVEPRTARLQFSGGRAALAGFALAGGGEVTAQRSGPDAPVTAEALLRLTGAEAHGWSLSAPAEVRARWNGAELGLSAGALELKGACPLQVAALEATAGGWSEGHPRMVAQGQVALAAGHWLAADGAAWHLEPETVAAKVTLNAVLEAGNEGVRAELAVPAQRRTLAWPGGRFEAVLGADAVINIDREHISGRATLQPHDIIARSGPWSLMAPEATLELRWPRVWLRALAKWDGASAGRIFRELLWAGDYEAKLSDAVVREGAAWCATGVAVKARSRGAELHETGGVTVELTAVDLVAGNRRTTDWQIAAAGGLEGGAIKAACFVPDLQIRPTVDQTVRWSDALEVEGTFGFDPVLLGGKEPLASWWPALTNYELSGGIGLSGRDRLAQGEWTLGADLILNDFNVRRPARNFAVEGVRGRLVWTSLAPLRTAPAQTLTYQRVAIGAAELLGGSATFAFEAPGALTVEQWASAGFGGRLESAAFAVDLGNPDFGTKLKLKGVKLEQLLKLFDDVPAEADGSVDGSIPVSWRNGRLGFGTGYLRLAEGEFGRVRFTRDLRLLTEGRNPNSPEYASLRQVEQAIRVLMVNRLQIDTYPKDAAGQSMRVRLVGAPAGGEFEVPVSIDVNVNAPLEHFLNWGLGNRPPAAPVAAP